ncbi:MAG: DUF1990 domain-containing protein [Acidimicrobiales bacterium]
MLKRCPFWLAVRIVVDSAQFELEKTQTRPMTARRRTFQRECGVAIRLRRPTPESLHPLLDRARNDAVTYAPVGLTSQAGCPAGYRRDSSSTVLGHGGPVFARARDALRAWEMHKASGFVVLAEGPPTVDGVVALSAPLPVGFIEATCRIVDVVDTADRYGFAYGTLSTHPERGEESFTVIRHEDDSIVFEIVVVSQPRNPLARACPPVARLLQRKATARYLATMRAAAAVA